MFTMLFVNFRVPMFGRTLPPCSCGSRRLVQCDRGDEVEAFWWKGTMNFVSREKKLICCQLLQVDIVEGDHEVLLTFENGVTASADLVVASDGIHSFVSRCRVWHYDHPSAALILSPIDAFCSGRSPLFSDQRKSETRRLDLTRNNHHHHHHHNHNHYNHHHHHHNHHNQQVDCDAQALGAEFDRVEFRLEPGCC